ncbi:MAG: galactosyldiacylglycerol synthase [Candidatus Binataceae bacterium]|jgi:1,2-diacylglycerol 3-beta-galactosyltransferase
MSTVSAIRRAQREPLIDLIYFDAGGGHRASALALKAVVESQGRPWTMRMVNLREVLEPIDVIRRLTGVRVENFYNGMLKHNLTIGVGPMLPVMHMLIRQMHRRKVGALARYWREPRPDLVVSLIPHFNRAIFDGLRTAAFARGDLPSPMVTIMTDLADYPPHFWIERQEQHVICGTDAAAHQARAIGCRPEQILRASGMIVSPEFYQPLDICPARERSHLGLRPDLPTGLVMFGGFGSRRMVTIAKRVAEAGLKTQLIFLCGHNQRVRERLAAMKLPFPHHLEGFTRKVPYFMSLSDFFIGKPGPGSISEALVKGLPVIVERNASTMVQERFNTEWIQQNRVGVVLRSFAGVARAIAPMLDPEQLARFHSRVGAINNRAVFEIPDMLEALLTQRPEEFAHQALMA